MPALRRLITLTALALVICSAAYSQQPAPTALPYSESIAYKPRVFQTKSEKKSRSKANAAANTPSEPSRPEPPEEMPEKGPTVSEDAPITVPISVFDIRGSFVTDLKQDDFKLFVDDSEARVLSVERRKQPLNILILLDTSPSGGEAHETTKKLAVSILDQFSANDKISVFTFAGRMKQVMPKAADRAALKTAISKIKPGGDGTSLYDSTVQLLTDFVPAASGRSIIILVTDGVDTTSVKSSYTKALVAAERSDVAIFPFYLDTFASTNSRSPGANLPAAVQQILGSSMLNRPTVDSTQDEYALGRLFLNDLVILSGSRAIEVDLLSIGKLKVPMNIADELSQQYYLTFSPVGSAYVGQRKHLKIRIDRPNLAVITRGSYIVGSPPSGARPQ